MTKQIILRRRKLLPWWMTFFIWIFMFLGASGLFLMIWEIIGSPINFTFMTERSIYGMETYDGFSLLGLFISSIILFKGFTAYTMWTEKDIAIKLGLIDASIGIIVCIGVIIVYPFFNLVDGTWNMNLRFEILFLIPYLIKCWKIRKPWEEFKESIFAENKLEIKNKIIPEQKTEQEIKKANNNDCVEMDKEAPQRFMPK
ncbi:hypothetical protein [Aquimarina pacifica]|uniref:hypothetical protein n=1 Tax=Aquimarina pacifica TaxID=1296415 RepID=UPI00047121CA|nr:hypothetical protein [Aquimarina pacifica]